MIPLDVLAKTLGVPAATSTVLSATELTPWLAAEGPFAFPPAEIYKHSEAVDYGNVMPSAFEHEGEYPFGGMSGRLSPAIDCFLNFAKTGDYRTVHELNGRRLKGVFQAPIAVYEFEYDFPGVYVLSQNGSFRVLEKDAHPEIAEGKIKIFRGIGNATTFGKTSLPGRTSKVPQNRLFRELYLDYVSAIFVNSASTFAFTNCNCKNKSAHISRRPLYPDFVQKIFSLYDLSVNNIFFDTFIGYAFRVFRTSYTVNEVIASKKFGPNYVAFETPINNVMLSSQFTGEGEVKVIDPNLLRAVRSSGCSVYDYGLSKWPAMYLGIQVSEQQIRSALAAF